MHDGLLMHSTGMQAGLLAPWRRSDRHRTPFSSASQCCWGPRATCSLSAAALKASAHNCGSAHRSHAFGAPQKISRGVRTACCATTSLADTKTALLDEVADIDCGIFGVQAEKRKKIHSLIEDVEAERAAENITERLDFVAGDWRLLYSTISITGRRRTKLGLREFVRLGQFTQSIDLDRNMATNLVDFNISGLGFMKGALKIDASFAVASPSRVNIAFQSASLEPQQFQALFEANYELLLSIFNPEGWLDITYVDEQHRIGRDDKGNVFLLERL